MAETTRYPFWDQSLSGNPSLTDLQTYIETSMNQLATCAEGTGLKIEYITAETGWPSQCPDKDPPPDVMTRATPAKAAAYWHIVSQQYKPPSTDYRMFYWLFSDANPLPKCGVTWGALKADCNFIDS